MSTLKYFKRYGPIPPGPPVKDPEALKELLAHYGKHWTISKSASDKEIDELIDKVELKRRELSMRAYGDII